MPYDLVVSKKVVPLTIYFIKTLPYRKTFFVKKIQQTSTVFWAVEV